jgi:murein DD-endopeptidase MepM/ murein hydrolase activator NlpD
VRARIVLRPLSTSGKLVVVDLGEIATDRLVRPSWPAGAALAAGRYTVALHAGAPDGATLLRRARASGRTTLTVKPAPAPPAPVPVPAPVPAPVTPVAPAPSTDGVFPVAGPHTLGAADGRFGAGRPGHIHQGQDIIAAEGTTVVAPLAGSIVARDFQASGAGFYLTEDAADGRSFFFAHCQADSFAVALGATVVAGQPLCRVGHTGTASGPHLHFEIWVGGWRRSTASAPVDPLPQLLAWGG